MQITPLIGCNYSAKDLKDGDVLTIGGRILARSQNGPKALTLKVDSREFEPFFAACDEFYEKHKENLAKSDDWFREKGAAPAIASRLFAYNRVFEQFFPGNPAPDEARRMDHYRSNGRTSNLSDALKTNVAQCAECAALAQLYAQRCGFDSSFINGEVLWQKTHEFGEEHSYVAIRQPSSDSVLIFDPANPHTMDNGKTFPYLATVNATLWEQALEHGINKPQFVESTNVLMGANAHYGVGCGDNILPDHFVTPPAAAAHKTPERNLVR
ncbi:MAG: hypothetical protein WCD70_01580 [Alphaproteobacteria bacterium]